jgi:hypothetical protein
MFTRRLVWPLCAALLAAISGRGEELNVWPVVVRQSPPDSRGESVQYAGPLLFSQQVAGKVWGFRPLYIHGEFEGATTNALLYPLVTWQEKNGFRQFSFFQLVNNDRRRQAQGPDEEGLDVWPLYTSRQTGDPATSYRALFPIAGTVRQRFGKERLTWYLFPIYLNTDRAGMEVTTVVWPIFRFVHGEGHHGFEIWPLGGRRGREGDYDRQFYLWPIYHKSVRNMSEAQPDVSFGVLPFYSMTSGPGYRSETYGWPFFGYTHRTIPAPYDERRYFWPFLVQGHGEKRSINRWAPFYTHSLNKGYDKTWVMWPLYRRTAWEDETVAQEKKQLLFFLYWSQTQRSLTNPAAAPAYKTHFWPFVTVWDNGAGRRQVQALSPLEVFFPANDFMRQLYTPFFALYRYERQDATTYRHSLLWNAVTWRRHEDSRAFHLGPLFSVQRDPTQKRIALISGVIGWQRRPGEQRGRFFLFDFARKTTNQSPGTPPS